MPAYIILKMISVIMLTVTFLAYTIKGVNSSKHRFFPLICMMTIVYNTFDIILQIRGLGTTIPMVDFVEKLYFVLVMYVIFLYELDFLKAKIKISMGMGIFLVLSITIAWLHNDNVNGRDGLEPLHVYVGIMAMGMLGIGTYCLAKYSMTKQDKLSGIILYVATIVPLLAIVISKAGWVNHDFVLPISAMFSSLCFLYLILSGRMVDTLEILRESGYYISGAPQILVDSDGYYLDANPLAHEVFKEEIDKFETKKVSEKWLQTIKDIVEGRCFQEIEKNGRYFVIHTEKVYHERRLRGHLIILVDVTSQKNDTMAMENLKNIAEDVSAKRGMMMATLSHDLKSPLYAILGASDLLLSKESTTYEDKILVNNIKRAGKALLVLVNDILNFSKNDSGNLKLEEKPYDFEMLIKDICCINIVNIRNKPVDLKLVFETEVPKYLVGDELRVREIIQNLMSNAVKFTQAGEVICYVKVDISEENARFTVRVKDTGKGMSKQQLETVFENYVSFAGEYNVEGSGLGLCIVKQLCEKMEGTVTAESDGVSGSLMTATFVQKTENQELCPVHTFEKEELLSEKSTEGMQVKPDYIYPEARVLLVDDLSINLEIFKAIAAPWKFAIDTATDGWMAMGMAQNQDYDMIFMDILMPKINGIDASREIRKFSDVPIVLLSASLDSQAIDEYKKAGFKYALSKPFEMLEVKKVIEGVLPEKYRKPFVESNQQPVASGPSLGTLRIFSEELKEILDCLSEASRNDLDLFRIKVHGLKGAARQFGYTELSEQSEVMEMAAKTENKKYIDRHLQEYLIFARKTQNEIEQSIINAEEAVAINDTSSENIKNEYEFTKAAVREYFSDLKTGFEDYDVDKIESALQMLKKAQQAGALETEQKDLLVQVTEDYHHLDYEKGYNRL